MPERNQKVWQLSVKPVAGRICALQLPNEIGASFIVVIPAITLYGITIDQFMAAYRARNSFITLDQKEFLTFRCRPYLF